MLQNGCKAKPSKQIHQQTQHIYEFILTRFGCPFTLVSDQGTHFINDTIEVLTIHFLLRHTDCTTHYPHVKNQAKSTNKVIELLLTKLGNEIKTNSDEHLHTILYV